MSENYYCCICGKPATVCKKETINGVTKEYYYCDECFSLVENGHPLESLLSAMFNFGGSSIGLGGIKPKMRVCQCGMTERDILNSGKFGCSECYNVFRDIAESFVNKRGNLSHKGKVPNKHKQTTAVNMEGNITQKEVKEKSKLEKLKEELAQAVKEERYLDCDKISKQIAKLEKEGK